jgi:DNA-binding CsgD family transcriptional regulator/tetratricopeptide (TPR) repeat protein
VAAGDLRLALDVARESVEITRDLDDALVSTYAGLALAGALFETGEAERAVDVLMTAAGGEDLPLVPGGWKANYFELLTRCWLALGRGPEAEQAATRAAVTAGEVGLDVATAMAHRAAAAVAIENGDPATAADRALTAVAAADRSGARVDAALARTLAGRALAHKGDCDRAVVALEYAARELDACGAVRYRNQAEHELRKLGRTVHRRTRQGHAGATGVEALTGREAEIARLVVDRRTNPEIASALFLSVKTVETHLRNIFGKLGVSSRVEVARAVERADRAPA